MQAVVKLNMAMIEAYNFTVSVGRDPKIQTQEYWCGFYGIGPMKAQQLMEAIANDQPIERTCVKCGKCESQGAEFYDGAVARCLDCMRKYNREYGWEYYDKVPLGEGVCDWCGKTFWKTRNHQILCKDPECRRAHKVLVRDNRVTKNESEETPSVTEVNSND